MLPAHGACEVRESCRDLRGQHRDVDASSLGYDFGHSRVIGVSAAKYDL